MSSPTYPAWVSVVQSHIAKGTSRQRASVCANNVFPVKNYSLARQIKLILNLQINCIFSVNPNDLSVTVQYYNLGQCWQHKPEPVGPSSMMLLFSSLISVCVESRTSPPLFSWGACWLACCCMDDAPRAFPWGLIPAICSSSATISKATGVSFVTEK